METVANMMKQKEFTLEYKQRRMQIWNLNGAMESQTKLFICELLLSNDRHAYLYG